MLLDLQKMGALKYAILCISTTVMLYLLLPIIFIISLSFGNSLWMAFPPPSWTVKWYVEMFNDPKWLIAAFTSFKIAAAVTIITVVVGFLGAFAVSRSNFRGKSALQMLFLAPMIAPVIVFSIAIYGLFLRIGLAGTYVGFVLSHVVLALPLAIIIIGNAIDRFDKSIEEAAILCGASPWVARLKVTIPGVSHGIMAAAIFAFLTSWEEVVVGIFMSSPTLQTLPVRIWGALRQDLTPVVTAVSSSLIILTALLLLLTLFTRKRVWK